MPTRSSGGQLTVLGRKGTHLTSSRPWLREWVALSATNLASMMATMAGRMMRTSLDICRGVVWGRDGAGWGGGARGKGQRTEQGGQA